MAGMGDIIPTNYGMGNLFGSAWDAAKAGGRGLWDMYTNPKNKAFEWAWPITTTAAGAALGAMLNKKSRVGGAAMGGMGGLMAGLAIPSAFGGDEEDGGESDTPDVFKRGKKPLLYTGPDEPFAINAA